MTTYTSLYIDPVDYRGNRIKCGDTVYLPNGWTGTKPNPWKSATVCGVCLVNGRSWIDLDGYDLLRVLAYIVSLTPVP